jgi:hypothetical protein
MQKSKINQSESKPILINVNLINVKLVNQMTLPNKNGYAVAPRPNEDESEKQETSNPIEIVKVKPTPTSTKIKQNEEENSEILEEISKIKEKYSDFFESFQKPQVISGTKRKFDSTFEENNNQKKPHFDEELGTCPQELEFLDSSDVFNHMKFNSFLNDLDLQVKMKYEECLIKNKEKIESILGSMDNESIDYIKELVKSNPLHPICHQTLQNILTGSLHTPDPQNGKKKDKNQVSIIEMTPDEILLGLNFNLKILVFVGKNDAVGPNGNDKPENVTEFLNSFLQFQGDYRKQCEFLNESKTEWTSGLVDFTLTLQVYEKLFQSQSQYRFVSEIEIKNATKMVETKIDKMFNALKEKYITKVFDLQDRIFNRTKKRGNLPKNATNVLKSWLFQHFLQ